MSQATTPDTTHRILRYEPREPLEGHDVMQVQNALTLLGFPNPSNGIYDAATRSTVVAFQNRFREELVIDGIVGQKTRAVLVRELGKKG